MIELSGRKSIYLTNSIINFLNYLMMTFVDLEP